MKLSVIVPVYNVERFLPRCLDSLLRQGMEAGEWEVICVNDGSPDNSAAILAEYEKKYPDVFKVITQENQGLGGARNTGTALAQGEWIAYLDSDDYIIDGAYRYLLDHFCGPIETESLRGKQLDVLCYAYYNVYTDGISLADPDAKPDGEVTFEGDGGDAYNHWPLHYVWSKFYRRAFLEEHHIESEIVICQDQLFNFDVFRQHPPTRIVSSKVVRYENGNATSIQKITQKETVLVQLNDLYYNMGVIHRYLEGDKADMTPAAWRTMTIFVTAFTNKLGRLSLCYSEWKKYIRLIRPSDILLLNSKKDTSVLGAFISWLKMCSLRYYVSYLMNHWLYKYVFDGNLRKLIVSEV